MTTNSIPALLIGGPAHGEILELREPLDLIRLPTREHETVGYRGPLDNPLEDIAIVEAAYVRMRLAFFGRYVTVWVHDSIATDLPALYAAMSPLLLTDLCRGLAELPRSRSTYFGLGD